MKGMWNTKYGGEDYFYGKKPNVFFKGQIKNIKPGTIFFPAEGEGRNAVYAAKNGWSVDAIDSSEAGRDKAMKLAKEEACTINYMLSDIFDLDLQGNKYDVVVWCFLHLPETQRTAYIQKLIKSIKPGGRLILEAFSKNQWGRTSGGPKNIDLLYKLEDLKRDLKQLQLVIAEETETMLDEGTGHKGKAKVIRIIAIKKTT